MKRLLHRFVPIIARHGGVALGRNLLAHGSERGGDRATSPALFIDVSVLAKHDARTGIQRIVRGVLQALGGSSVFAATNLLCASRNGYYLARWDVVQQRVVVDRSREIQLFPGDIFLALDLAAHLLPQRFSLLARWKAQGVRIVPVVYDLLPETHPEWFNPKTVRHFYRWLRVCAKLADGFVTISESVKAELQTWLVKQGVDPGNIPIAAIWLAGDVRGSYPSQGLPVDSSLLIERFLASPTTLMVGTVEPRKGHAEALATFEHLWREGHDVNLVIVGKPGWKTESLQQRLASHPFAKQRLFWFSDASDEWLAKLYKACKLVLVASKGEGLGLPVVEAMANGRPVLARNLLVFREIAGDRIFYFDDDLPELLASKILSCLEPSGPTPAFTGYSWEKAVAELTQFLMVIGMANTRQVAPHSILPGQI